MNSSPFFAFDPFLAVPIAGLAGFLLVLLVGRMFLANKRRRQQQDEVEIDPVFLKGVTQDRRAVPRRKGNILEVQLLEGETAPPFFGAVLDRSQGGLKLTVSQPVAEGTVLKVKPTNASISTPWIEIIVRSCARDGNAYILGCQFRGMPNMGVLLQFG